MNPLDRFKIDRYKEVLQEIEKLGKLEYLRDLEDKIIKEIVRLVSLNTKEAKQDLKKLEQIIEEDLDFKPRNNLLVSALRKSIKGALSAARFCL